MYNKGVKQMRKHVENFVGVMLPVVLQEYMLQYEMCSLMHKPD